MPETDRLPALYYEIESSKGTLPADVRVFRFRMTEAVSEPYTIVVDVATTDVDYDFEDLLGYDAQINLIRGELVRSVYGIVTEIDWLGISGDRLMLRITIRPAFALLEQEVNSRIFQDLSVIDILDKVLKVGLDAYSRKFEKPSGSRGTTVREYCTQYNESDFAFISRLLEEEGINYVFRHDEDAGAEIMQLVADNTELKPTANVDESDVFPVIVHNPDYAETESVQAIEWRRRLTSTGVMRRDVDWREPTKLLDASADKPDARGRSRRVYVHGQRRFVKDDLAERAGDLKAVLARPGTRGYGRGNAAHFHAGLTFSTSGHALSQLDDQLLLLRVEHEGHDPSALPSLEAQDDGQGGYSNVFECTPASVELRPPPVTPKPQPRGPQSATVTGPSGEEIHVDEHGRVKVQFPWEEKPAYDDTSSCWVRIASPMAGANRSGFFLPRVGDQVLVSFMEGSIDRPVVIGSLWDEKKNTPPYPLPDNKTRSGIKTLSSPGGDGFNELYFEDAAGSEEIHLHAQKNWTIAVENDKTQTIKHDESLEVTNDRKKTVKHDEIIQVDNDEKITIGHDHIEQIKNDMSLTVTGNQTVKVDKDHTETIGKNRSDTIKGNVEIVIDGTKSETVGKDTQAVHKAAYGLTIKGEASGKVEKDTIFNGDGELQLKIGKSGSLQFGKDLVIKSNDAGQLSTGKALGISSDDKLSVNAKKDLSVAGKAKVVIEAADEFTIKCGSAQITIKKSGDITIKGGKIDIQGSGPVNIKGAKVNNN